MRRPISRSDLRRLASLTRSSSWPISRKRIAGILLTSDRRRVILHFTAETIVRNGLSLWMDDTLRKAEGVNPKKHLHDTLQNLNRHQLRPWLHLRGDGSGRRFGWELR